jgi:hypothetical protein
MRGFYGNIASSLRLPVIAAANGVGGVRVAGGVNLLIPSLSCTDNACVAASYWVRYPTAYDARNLYAYMSDARNQAGTWAAVLNGGSDDGKMEAAFQYSDNTNGYYYFDTQIGGAPSLNQWHHFLIVFNGNPNNLGPITYNTLNPVGPSQLSIYMDRVLVNSVSTNNRYSQNVFIPTLNGDTFNIFSDGTPGHPTTTVTADVADFWFDVGANLMQADGTVSSATLDKFVTSDLKPVPLGTNGELPTGSTPTIFMHRDRSSSTATDFATNRGTGGTVTASGGLISVAATNPDGTTDLPPLPPPTQVVVADFKNGTYSIGGVTKTLADILVADTAYGPYNSTNVVSGTGLTSSNSVQVGPVLTAAAQAAVLAAGIDAGYTAVMKFNITGGGAIYAELVDDGFNNGWGCVMQYSGSNLSNLYDYTANPASTLPMSGAGQHTVAFTLSATELAGSVDGGSMGIKEAPIQAASASPIIGIYLAPNPGSTVSVESISFYHPVNQIQLPGLSG